MEVEALKSIYDQDYSQEIIEIHHAWKPKTQNLIHKIQLNSRDDQSISIILSFQFVDNYPDSPPILNLEKSVGVGDIHLKNLKLSLEDYVKTLIGQEMIFEISNYVIDYITEHNQSMKKESAHETMNKILKAESSKAMLMREKEKLLERENINETNVALAQKVQTEIDKKKSLMMEEKQKRNKFYRTNTDNPIKPKAISITPTLGNAIICPLRHQGCKCIFQLKLASVTTQIAWFMDLETSFLVETHELSILHIIPNDMEYKLHQLQTQLQKAKAISHSSVPITYDFDIKHDKEFLTVKVLTSDFRHISLIELLRISGTLSVSVARSILSALLSLLEELGENFESVGDITIERIWFDQSLNPVLSGLFYSTTFDEISSKQKPKKAPDSWKPVFSNVGGFNIEQFSSLQDCINRVANQNPDIINLINHLMDNKTARTIASIRKLPLFHLTEDLALLIRPENRSITPPPQDISFLIPNTPSDQQFVSRYQSDFQEIEFLGRGGFGAVVKAKNIVDNRFYAIKKIRLNPSDKEGARRLLREVQTLSRLQSEYIVRYHQAWFEEAPYSDGSNSDSDSSYYSDSDASSDDDFSQSSMEDAATDWLSADLSLSIHRTQSRIRCLRSFTEEGSPVSDDSAGTYTQMLYIQMEYCEKKTLRDAIDEGIEMDTTWAYLRQMLEGIGHLHSQGIIHRDLKPSNVFFDMNGRIKIGDFGLATAKENIMHPNPLLNLTHSITQDDRSLTSDIGTPVYIAPEVLSKSSRYNSKVDMYSLGILFFEMVYKMNTGMQRVTVLRDLRNPEICFPKDFDFEKNKDPAEIIRLLLNHIPRERPSCAQLLQSSLIPTNIEGEYINEDLLKIVRQKNPSYFSRVINALFCQTTDLHKDFAYDFNANQINFHPLTALVKSLLHQHVLKVFIRHAAVQISPPLILPKTPFINDLYSTKRTSEFLDQNGDVVQLYHDLTVPFARFLAQSVDEQISYPLKRFSIDRVFRKNIAGGQPRAVEECDFDIIYDVYDDSMVAEAEVIKVVYEMLEFGYEHKFINPTDFFIRVNHTQPLMDLISSYGVSSTTRSAVLEILSQLHKPCGLVQTKTLLSKLGVPNALVECLAALDKSITINSKTTLAELLLVTNRSIATRMLKLATNLSSLGITSQLTFDPLLVYNHDVFANDFVFQIYRKVKSKYGKYFTTDCLDVIAAGGRYESILNSFRSPFMARTADLFAVGVNVSLSKFIATMTEYQLTAKIDANSNPCRKADVVLVAIGENETIEQHRLTVAKELWDAGISTDFCLVSSLSPQDDLFSQWKNEYLFAVIVKAKGFDSQVIKVRNFVSKTETEAEHQESSFLKKQDVHVIPLLGTKKSKFRNHLNVASTEKSLQVVVAAFENSPIVVVDMTSNDVTLYRDFWFTDEESFKKVHHSIGTPGMKEYLLSVRKQLLKLSKEGKQLIWIFSTVDSKALPLLLQ
ncbi:hypothetical protein HDV02_004198 [Globomyces sp. JEL0801]|nr:hypothetical protein HDV02_004198 [Globomyces sp. JEL0801]